jgi:hypothetical protein
MNTWYLSQLSATIRAPGARQAGNLFLGQGTLRQGVETGVEGLSGNPPRQGFRPQYHLGAGNLTGRPTLPQKVFHHAKQDRVYRQLARPTGFQSLATRRLAGPLGVIATGAHGLLGRGQAAPFPADRRGGTAQEPRHGAQTHSLVGHHPDRRPLFGRQLFVVSGHRNTLKGGGVARDSRPRRVILNNGNSGR